MKPRSHTHDWQWSEDQNRYLCHCGETLLSEATPNDQPVDQVQEEPVQNLQQLPPVEQPGLVQHTCYSCLGSGYSDYAIGQPCEVCQGWGYWESIV